MNVKLKFFLAVLAAALFATVTGASAQDGLTMVRPENLGGAVERLVTLEELRALPQVTVNTENEFEDGMNAYTGPLARDVIQIIGQGIGTSVKLIAANDYAVDVDIQEFVDYDVIFAMDMNGQDFSPRDRGPIWLIYPASDHEELKDQFYNNHSIWQLVRLEVQ